MFVFFVYASSMAATLDRTVLPPLSGSSAAHLAQIAAAASGHNLSVTLPDGTVVAVPPELAGVLHNAAALMLDGRAVTIAPRDTILTTQQAAELLGVSRPTLVRLLEAGEIPYTQPGRHRRVALTDLIHYQERMRTTRRSALAAMSQDAAEDDQYVKAPSFVATR